MNGSHFEIMSNILLLSRKKNLTNSISHIANFSHSVCQEYFRYLLKNDLLRLNDNDGNEYYETTTKGIRFMEHFKEIQDLLANKDENIVAPTKLDLIYVNRKQ
jgi:predicted transcriptional regulator